MLKEAMKSLCIPGSHMVLDSDGDGVRGYPSHHQKG